MKKSVFLTAIILLGLAYSTANTELIADADSEFQAPNLGTITIKDIKSDVFFLASDAMKGRETLRAEADITAAYVKSRFQRAGVKPAGENGSYYQTVKLQYQEWSETPSLTVTHDGAETQEILYESGFVSTRGPAGSIDLKNAGIEFAGYAISDKNTGYDDLAGVDLSGKIAVILRYQPTNWRKKGRRNPFSRNSHIRTKAALLKKAGAVAILMVTGPESVAAKDSHRKLPSPKAAEESPPLSLVGSKKPDSGNLPFFQITLEAADTLLGGAGETSRIQLAFDKNNLDARPDLSKSTISLSAKSLTRIDDCQNVAAMIEGKTDEWVIFGAHHDHLGFGYFGARDVAKGGMGQVHNGADDNASGVSTVLEIAEAFAESGVKPNRNFLFLTFTGEEKGLLGSSWYVDHPLVPHEKVAAMINIDMIGRLENHQVSLTGTGCSTVLHKICKDVAPMFPELDVKVSGKAPMAVSDHWPFFKNAGIPVFFPFGGINDLMHTALDDAETINYTDLHLTIKLLAEIGWRVSESPDKPDYVGPFKPKEKTDEPAKEEDFSVK